MKCLHLTSSRREMCTMSVSNVIYHKFSHGVAFYTLNGKNVNVMLEFAVNLDEVSYLWRLCQYYLFTRLPIQAFSDVEKLLLFSDLAIKQRNSIFN